MRWAVQREVAADATQRAKQALRCHERGGGLVAATRIGGLTAATHGLMAAVRGLTAATCDLTAATWSLMAAIPPPGPGPMTVSAWPLPMMGRVAAVAVVPAVGAHGRPRAAYVVPVVRNAGRTQKVQR